MAVNGLGIKYDPYQYFKKAQAENRKKRRRETGQCAPKRNGGAFKNGKQSGRAEI